MDQNINYSKSRVWKSFFWKYYFWHATFLYLFKCSSEHQSSFNISFSSRKSQSQQKLAKKITHFTIQFFSKNLTRFRNLNSLVIENNMLPQHSQKPFWLKNFPANMFLFGARKNIWTAPFLDAQELHFSSSSESKCLYISVYLRKIYFVPET